MPRFAVFVVALLGLLFASTSLHAQTRDEAATGRRLAAYSRLQDQLLALFEKKDYEKAAAICRKQMQLIPESAEPHYNYACAMARLGNKDEAMLELSKAVEHGFTDTGHMREDEDLTALHDEQKFKDLLTTVREKELSAPHETAADLDGVKTIENFPESGLRYRLRIDPKADAKHPARLLIWLHPSGGSMDDVIEQMAPRFAKDGFALLVFTQKNYDFWSDQDSSALIDKTLPDVAKIEGVDAKKPILLGFSAGGQLAMMLWEHNPAAFGGVIIDAAYPLDPEKYARGEIGTMNLPKTDAIKSCPIYVVVGGEDRGSVFWENVDKAWHDAHVPLTTHIIEGKGHQWLFNLEESVSLHQWLKEVAAGKLPSDKPAASRHLFPSEDNDPIKV